MAECTGIGPHINPPAPEPSGDKAEIMAILGVEEIEISMTDEQGNVTTAIVLGRIAEEG